MPYDGGDLTIKVEIEIDGVMTTITSRSRSAGGLHIKHAEGDGANSPQTSVCRLVIGNDDGWLTEDNVFSPWAPHFGRNTKIRVSLTGILPSDAYRFTGRIDYMEAVYPGGESSSMYVEAIGTWGSIELDEEEPRSAMFRTSAGPFFGPVNAVAYWSLEDPEGSPNFRWSLAGTGPAMYPANGGVLIEPAADSAMRGSQPVVTVTNPVGGGGLTAIVPDYTDNGDWMLAFPVRFTGEVGVCRVVTTSTTVPIIEVRAVPATNTYTLTLKNAAGGTVASNSSGLSKSPVNDWIGFSLVSNNSNDFFVAFRGSNAESYGGPGLNGGAGAHAKVVSVTVLNFVAIGTSASVGHVKLIPTEDASAEDACARAIHGWDGEDLTDRLARLGDEAGVTITVLGGSTQRMGPQPTATLTALFTGCQQVDQGLFCDDPADEGLVYRTATHMATQKPAVRIRKGALTPDTRPIWDHRRTRNQWTVSRLDGGTATQADEDHVERIRRRVKDTAGQLNLYSDDQLDSQARWRVNVGVAPGPRYASLGINLRNSDGVLLADAILEMSAGDRLLIDEAAFPSQHPPGGADQLVRGWEEVLDADKWEIAPVTVPYRPYDDVGRWNLLSHELRAAINSSVTSIDIANTDVAHQPMLETDPAKIGSGYSITVNAEEMRLTAVASPSSPTFATGAAAHADNASVSPAVPTVQDGDVLFLLAAIRNSGTGVPNTPTEDYVRLPAFPANSNVQLFGKISDGTEAAPTVSFTGGVAGATCSARIARFRGLKAADITQLVVSSSWVLNPSAQNITHPGLTKPDVNNGLILLIGWKQDDNTGVATLSGASEVFDDSSTLGDDQSIVMDRIIQTAAAAIPSGVFTVSGGASAISRAAVVCIHDDYQTATVERGINGLTASHAAGDEVTQTRPLRWGP